MPWKLRLPCDDYEYTVPAMGMRRMLICVWYFNELWDRFSIAQIIGMCVGEVDPEGIP